MTLGYSWKQYRKAHGIDLRPLSRLSGLPSNVLRDMEEDRVKMDGGALYEISTSVGISPFEVLGIAEAECRSAKEARRVLRPYVYAQAKGVGRRLASRRQELGLSMSDVGKMLGKAPAIISDYERGVYSFMPPDIQTGAARCLKTSKRWILGNTRSPTTPPASPPLPCWAISADFNTRDNCNRVLAFLKYNDMEERFREEYGREVWESLRRGELELSKAGWGMLEGWVGRRKSGPRC